MWDNPINLRKLYHNNGLTIYDSCILIISLDVALRNKNHSFSSDWVTLSNQVLVYPLSYQLWCGRSPVESQTTLLRCSAHRIFARWDYWLINFRIQIIFKIYQVASNELRITELPEGMQTVKCHCPRSFMITNKWFNSVTQPDTTNSTSKRSTPWTSSWE